MFRHQEDPCFLPLMAAAETVCRSAAVLREMAVYYDPAGQPGRVARLHTLTTAVRGQEEQLAEQLRRAFLAPLEREDLALIMRHLRRIPAAAETAGRLISAAAFPALLPEEREWTTLFEEGCGEVRRLMEALPRATKEKASDQADRMLSWYDRYERLQERAVCRFATEPSGRNGLRQLLLLRMETCCRDCLRLAETVEWVVLKNT